MGWFYFSLDATKPSTAPSASVSFPASLPPPMAESGLPPPLPPQQHSVQERSSGSTAAAYIGLEGPDGQMYWGAGTDTDIIKASASALIGAYNNMTV